MRETWADKAKFLGITLMLIGHNEIANDRIFDFIYSFHMSLFFILSGYFASIKNIDYKSFLQHNIKGLIVPYVLFYIITLPFGYLVRYINFEEHNFASWWEFAIKPIIGLFTVKTTDFAININGPTWFIVALFLVKTMFFFTTKRNCTHQRIFLSVLLSIVLLVTLKKFVIDIYFRIDCALLGYPFYVLGYYLKNMNLVEKIKKRSIQWKGVYSIFCLLSCFYIGNFNGHVEFSAADYGSSLILMFITSITGSLGIVFIAMCIPDNKTILKLGSGTLVILGLHSQVQTAIRYMFSFIFDIPTTSYPMHWAIIIVFITLLFHIPLINIYNKHLMPRRNNESNSCCPR